MVEVKYVLFLRTTVYQNCAAWLLLSFVMFGASKIKVLFRQSNEQL